MNNDNPMTDNDWFDTINETKKQPRRDAADEFLEDISKDPGLRTRVLKSDEEARKEFTARYKKATGIDIPPEVRVICVDPDLAERGKLVVFLLPTIEETDENAPAIRPTWGEGWIAAWQPY